MFGTSGDPRKGHLISDKSKSTSPEPIQTVSAAKPPGSPKKTAVGTQPQTPPSPIVGTGLGQGVPDQTAQPPSVTEELKPTNVSMKQMQQPVVQPPPDKPVVQGNRNCT